MTRRACGPAALALAFVWAAGCSNAPATGTVTGTVTLDGQPLKAGTVKFVPADEKTPPVSAAVTDGKFTAAAVPAGDNRVEFSAPKVVGKIKMYDTPDSPVTDETAESLPARYNVRSELRVTVRTGTQDETFTLTSK